MKLIVDLIYEGGIERMHYSISDTAEYGSHAVGPRVVDEHVRENMRKVLRDDPRRLVRDASGSPRWSSGAPSLAEYRGRSSPQTEIEQVGKRCAALQTARGAGGAWRRLTSRSPCWATAPSARPSTAC